MFKSEYIDEYDQMSAKKKRKLARRLLKRKLNGQPLFHGPWTTPRSMIDHDEFAKRHERLHALEEVRFAINKAIDLLIADIDN